MHELIFVYSFLLDRILVSSVPISTVCTLKSKKTLKSLKILTNLKKLGFQGLLALFAAEVGYGGAT